MMPTSSSPNPSTQEFGSNNAAAGSRPGRAASIAGWIVTVLMALMLLLDCAAHFAVPRQVVDAFVRLGLPISLSVPLAILLLVCVVLYIVPKTSVFGVVLLTGYFGGAVAIQLRAGSPTFETVFPIILGAIAWAGIYLREPRLRAILPLRR